MVPGLPVNVNLFTEAKQLAYPENWGCWKEMRKFFHAPGTGAAQVVTTDEISRLERFQVRHHFTSRNLMKPIVQISLDLTNMEEALATAELALRAGVDWLEAGTPLLLAEGLHCVERLRERFPDVPIVADLKTMDGGYLEAEMMAGAGATHVVVMARAHEETVRLVVKAGRDFGIGVMGDNLAADDMVGAAKRLEDLGCDYIVHHIGYDERGEIARRGERAPNPLDQLREVVEAVQIPVQAVGGLTIEQAVSTPEYGAPLVVIGAPLAIDSDSFRTAGGDLADSLRLICDKVHSYGDVPVGKKISAAAPQERTSR